MKRLFGPSPKKALSLFLSLFLSFALFTGCSQSPSDLTPSESSPVESPSQSPVEPEAPTPTTEPITLNIGSYNIANGSHVKHDISKLGEDIKSKNLDIVGVQEVDQNVPRSGKINTMKLLSESSGLPYYKFFKAISLSGGSYGVGILSKYPITESTLHKLYSGDEEKRVLGHAVIDVNGVSVNFLVTHLSFESKELRDTQFAAIGEITAELDNFIVTGDFNTSDFLEYKPIKNSNMVNNGSYNINTFPSPNPRSSIDNIVFSKYNWEFGSPAVLPNGHSDHCMLYAKGTFYPEGIKK